jgi:hypothetical protein
VPSNSLDDVGTLVPEFYYDLIARIVPGAVLSLLVAWEWRSHLSPLLALGGAIVLPVGFVVSYVSGFFLDAISDVTVGRLNHLLYRLFHGVVGSGVWRTRTLQQIRLANRQDSSGINRRAFLIKMVAEKCMSRNLMVAWIACWSLGLSMPFRISFGWRILILAVLVTSYYWKEFVTRQEVLREFKAD